MLYDIPQAEKYCDGSRCMQKEKIATTSIESIYVCYDISNRIYILGKTIASLCLGGQRRMVCKEPKQSTN
jgi:hypothetical protein